jgi:DNA-binding NarL/FixJ family response regulator
LPIRHLISPKTATLHVSNILSKLGVTNRVAAATIAHRLGVASPKCLEREKGVF